MPNAMMQACMWVRLLRLLSLTALVFVTVGCRARELTQSIPAPAKEPSDPAAVETARGGTHRSVPRRTGASP